MIPLIQPTGVGGWGWGVGLGVEKRDLKDLLTDLKKRNDKKKNFSPESNTQRTKKKKKV